MHTCFSVPGYLRRPALEPRVSYDDAAPVTGRRRAVEATWRSRAPPGTGRLVTLWLLSQHQCLTRGISACPPHPRKDKKQRRKGRRNEEKKSFESLDKAIILMKVGKTKRRCSNPEVVRRNLQEEETWVSHVARCTKLLRMTEHRITKITPEFKESPCGGGLLTLKGPQGNPRRMR